MSMVRASSKLSGKSETGLAFGMNRPPWVDGAAYFSPHTSCWNALAVAFSASCYHIVKEIRVLSVIMAIRKLSQVQRQIGLADIVEGANHATLQQAPEAVQIRRMNVPAHVFTSA